jgi:hypothetical protein
MCKIRVPCGSDYEEYCLLRYDTIQPGRSTNNSEEPAGSFLNIHKFSFTLVVLTMASARLLINCAQVCFRIVETLVSRGVMQLPLKHCTEQEHIFPFYITYVRILLFAVG